MDTQNSYLASKPHYEILDGLRGVASVMVVAFHLLEAHSGGSHLEQLINHGYLAVDFFFMLSGFVIGYAYDDRWNRMSVGTFFKRRISYGYSGKHYRCGILLFSGVTMFSGYSEHISRNHVIGDAVGMYFASASSEVGHSRLDGNASVERTGLVALLRIHR